MPPTLHIQLLGEFRLTLDDQPLTTVNQRRQQALLAFLLLHRHAPQQRHYLAYSFWPDSTDSQALTNLRKLFFQLRQALPNVDDYIVGTSQNLGWRHDAPFSLDVAQVEQALDALEAANSPDIAVVQQVVALYQGDLLPACYEEWLLPLRSALHERVVNTLTHAIAGLEAQHEFQVALRAAEHLLRLDPLHEATYRHLMHLRALSGDRAGALRIYHECVTMLEQELGVSPATETQALYQRLLKSEPQATPAPQSTPIERHEHIPLVGRKQEWQLLQQTWHQTSRHGTHMVTVWGEAGVGKTRLIEELLHWARLRPGTVAYARAYAAEGALSYAPLTEWLRSEALRPKLATLEPLWLSELARLLPELLTEQPDVPPPVPMLEGWQRQRFNEGLARAVLKASSPLLLVLDDLHWCDNETLTWLRYLLRFEPQTPVLIVGTVRSETVDEQHLLHKLRHHLQREGQYLEIELAPLSATETVTLAGHVARQDMSKWSAQLYRETEGNPLFVVETVRAGLMGELEEHGKPEKIPTTVQAVISTRLSQLSLPTRHFAQLAATTGRRFTVDVLVEASDMDEAALVQALDELWRKRIVREQPDGYDFSHDKIREVIYQEISPMRRRHLHRRVAQALERLHANRLPELAGELAAHYEQAGNIDQALIYIQHAAVVAHRLYAHDNAIRYLRHGLKLAEHLSTSDENTKIRLELLTYLSFILMET